jgi:L-malate glycosyltransferase
MSAGSSTSVLPPWRLIDNARKRNVLLLLASFDTGGAESQLLLLARSLKESRHYRPHIACLRRTGALLKEAEALNLGDIGQFPFRFRDPRAFAEILRCANYLREKNIEVIHTEGFYTNLVGLTAATLARVPLRVGFRGETWGWRSPAQNRLERALFRLAHVVHANSEAVKNYLIRSGVPDEKIAVVHNGVDISQFTVPSRRQDPPIIALPPDRLYVTVVANMHHVVKDQATFLRAAKLVRDRVPAAAFVLAGEGKLMGELKALAAELGLQEDVYFLGRCDYIPKLLAVSAVCVLSSTAEGFSNVILEYLAASRPVVVTDVGGAREAVQDGETGYVVPPRDPNTMAERIIHLLERPALAHAMGTRGNEVIRTKFSSQAQLTRTEQLYDSFFSG